MSRVSPVDEPERAQGEQPSIGQGPCRFRGSPHTLIFKDLVPGARARSPQTRRLRMVRRPVRGPRLTPWRFAYPVAFTLLSSVVFLYLLFSPIGLVGGITNLFWLLLAGLLAVNVGYWALRLRPAPA